MRKDNQRRSNTGRNRRNFRKNNKPADTIVENSEEMSSTSTTETDSDNSEAISEMTASNVAEVEAAASTDTNINKVEERIEETRPVEEIVAKTEFDTEQQTAKPETTVKEQQGEKKTMSTTNSSSEKTEAKKANKTAETMPVVAQAPQKSGSGFASTLATFAFMLSVAAGGGIYWMWQQLMIEKNASADTIATLQQQLEKQLRQSQEAIKAEVSQSTSAIQQEVSQTQEQIKQTLDSKAQEIQSLTQQVEATASEKIAKAQENLTAAQTELGKANQEIAETQKKQQSLEVSIDGIYNRLGNTSREWVIAEADYLLKVANHRLQLEEDVTTAIQALTLADKRLSSLDDPALNEVRNVIAQELVSLQTLSIPDQTGIAMQLTQLQDQVDQLPLNARTQPTHQDRKEFQAGDAPQLEGWEAVPGAIMETLKGLVVVSYNDKPIEPLLSPEQIKNLHENLKLKLEQARIVLFRGDQEQYAANMDLAIAWTEKHFNNDEVSTKKFVDTLNYLKDKQVDLKVPDISSSLRSLRNVAKRMELNIPNMESNAKNNDDANSVALN